MIHIHKPEINNNTITCRVNIDDQLDFTIRNTLILSNDKPVYNLSTRSEGFVAILLQYAILNQKHIKVDNYLYEMFVCNCKLLKNYYETMFKRQFNFSIEHKGIVSETSDITRNSLCPFSFGVNSCCTYLSLTSRCSCLLVGNFDLHSEEHLIRIKEVAKLENKELFIYQSNINELLNHSFFNDSFGKHCLKDAHFFKSLCYIAIMYNLSHTFSTLYVSSWNKYDDATLFENEITLNANKISVELLSSKNINIMYYGNYTRFEKLQKCIQLDSEFFLDNLQVCDNASSTDYNCNTCNKCLMTTVALLILNVPIERLRTFDFNATSVEEKLALFCTNDHPTNLYDRNNKRSIMLFIQLFKDCIK